MVKVINIFEFRSSVEGSKGVVVVDFFVIWCGFCNMLGFVFVELGEEMKDKVRFVKVDIDESLEIV